MFKGFSLIILIVVVLVVISAVAGGAYLAGKNTANPSSVTNIIPTQSVQQATSAPAVSPTKVAERYPGTKEFTSSNLKIAFNYLPKAAGMEIAVKEVGTKVYIYDSQTPMDSGQFVEVFQKDPKDSLEEAVKKKFLAGRSEKECFVIASPATFKNYPVSYKAVEISFPPPANNLGPWWSNGEKCSVEYAQTSGIRYFLGDSSHPDRFLFFNIGQYGILAGTNLTWQDTIRFLD